MQTTLFTPELKNKEDRINALRGTYNFRSPYHKNKKMLPFIVHGRSFNAEFPVSCTTVYYRGWSRHNQSSNYKIESLEQDIKTGFLTKVSDSNY